MIGKERVQFKELYWVSSIIILLGNLGILTLKVIKTQNIAIYIVAMPIPIDNIMWMCDAH